MSLVTTARSYSAPSVRHSAAASAVLPEPTGPPRPDPQRAAVPVRPWLRRGRRSRPGCGQEAKNLSFRAAWTSASRSRRGSVAAGRLTGLARVGDGVDLRGEPGGDRGDGERVHGQQPLGGGGRPADRQVGGGLRGVARAPARRPRRRRRGRSGGGGAAGSASQARRRPGAAARPGPARGPAAGTRPAAPGTASGRRPRRPGRQRGGRPSAPHGRRPPPSPAGHRPGRVPAGGAGTSPATPGSVTTPGGDRLLHATGVRVPAGGQPGVGEGEQRGRHQNRK